MKSRSFQLYDEQGNPLDNAHAPKGEVLRDGLLHAAAHMWMWRRNQGRIEVLLQRRASIMLTYPNLLDVSAAGHLDGGEDPLTTAMRETKEEVGIAISASQLLLIAVVRCRLLVGDTGMVENEFQWVYLVELPVDTSFTLGQDEVDALIWKPLDTLKADIANPTTYKQYVPHGQAYFATLFEALDRVALPSA
jgi:isopentenyldiphosphate isomerase